MVSNSDMVVDLWLSITHDQELPYVGLQKPWVIGIRAVKYSIYNVNKRCDRIAATAIVEMSPAVRT